MRLSASEHDLKLLQGVWRQIAFEENGIADAPDDYGSPAALTIIDGRNFSVRTDTGTILLKGHFTLDATARPKAITWTDTVGLDAGKELPAIYRLEDERLLFIAADAGMPRPTEFRTRPGLTMRTFVRVR